MFSSLAASSQCTHTHTHTEQTVHAQSQQYTKNHVFVLRSHYERLQPFKPSSHTDTQTRRHTHRHTHPSSGCSWRWQAALLSIIHRETRAQTRPSEGEIKALPPARCNPITGLQIWLAPRECAFSCPSLATGERGWGGWFGGMCVVSECDGAGLTLRLRWLASPPSSCASVRCLPPIRAHQKKMKRTEKCLY